MKSTFNSKSIAVLPFVNIGKPENEYFSDGITEEIINALTRVNGLKVTARTSSFFYKNKPLDVRKIGNELGVETVLEGSARIVNERVRITALLIRTDNGFHIWSEKFDRGLSDIFELQDEISLLIAEKIRENFGHLDIREHLIQAPTGNVKAYDIYLKARYHHLKWDKEGIANGTKFYEEAIAIDPGFSRAYFGAAYCYAMAGSWGAKPDLLKIAKAYIDKGFQLDRTSDIGFFSRATLSFWGYWDFKKAHGFFKEAMAINPDYTEAEEGLAELYTAMGYFDLAMEHAKNVLAIDPLSPNHNYTKGNIHYLRNEFEMALDSMETTLEIDPNFIHAIELKQLCLIHLKEYLKLDAFLMEHPLSEQPNVCRTLYKLLNPEEDIGLGFDEIPLGKDEVRTTIFPWPLFLQVHQGNHELALEALEAAVADKKGQYVNFMNSPMFNTLHANERFQKLVRSTFDADLLPPKKEDAHEEGEDAGLLDKTEIMELSKKLSGLMLQEKPFVNTTLSLRGLAGQIDLHPNKLSWLLNNHFGKNFNDYINQYRIKEFQRLAVAPENNKITLLGLAYDSGFNSKTVFNTFFKKETGMTPKQWIKANS